MEYFGTGTTAHGHYRWKLYPDHMVKIGLSFSDLPFDPEGLTNNLPKGQWSFYQGGGFTVIAISGSPVDKRNGSKSVFWVNHIITMEQMIYKIKLEPMAMGIINKLDCDAFI